MIDLKDIQETVRGLIAGHAYFTGETVLSHLGLSDDQAEAALRTRGFAVGVLPVQGGRLTNQGAGAALVLAAVTVLIEINPDKNPSVANKNIYLAIANVIAAVRAHRAKEPTDFFRLAPEPFEQSVHDPGLLAYLVHFDKTAVL